MTLIFTPAALRTASIRFALRRHRHRRQQRRGRQQPWSVALRQILFTGLYQLGQLRAFIFLTISNTSLWTYLLNLLVLKFVFNLACSLLFNGIDYRGWQITWGVEEQEMRHGPANLAGQAGQSARATLATSMILPSTADLTPASCAPWQMVRILAGDGVIIAECDGGGVTRSFFKSNPTLSTGLVRVFLRTVSTWPSALTKLGSLSALRPR